MEELYNTPALRRSRRRNVHGERPDLGSGTSRRRLGGRLIVQLKDGMCPPGLPQGVAVDALERHTDRHRHLCTNVGRREERHALAPVFLGPHEGEVHLDDWQ